MLFFPAGERVFAVPDGAGLGRADAPAAAGDRRLTGFNPKAFVFREDVDFLASG